MPDKAQLYAAANPTLEQIRALGAERKAARARSLELYHHHAPHQQEMVKLGIPKGELAENAQISRPALAKMLDPTTPPE